jgi:hypothetical protein
MSHAAAHIKALWQEGMTEDAAVQEWSTQTPMPHRVEVGDAIPEKQEKQQKIGPIMRQRGQFLHSLLQAHCLHIDVVKPTRERLGAPLPPSGAG